MNALSVRQIYERWAPQYSAEPHNPLMAVEQRLMLGLLPPVAGLRVLDLACGSGRYARLAAARGAAQVVALDFSAAMLGRVSTGQRVCGELTSLPLRDGVFDLVLSGLALGHAADLGVCCAEIARVLASGGRLLYSDFHPDASPRGLTRSFTDADGRKFSLPPAAHDRAAHLDGLRRAGLVLDEVSEPRVGIEFTSRSQAANVFIASGTERRSCCWCARGKPE